MFTGLVEATGHISSSTPIGDGHDARFSVSAPDGFLERVAVGASISCSGCCLTAVRIGGGLFEVEASAETLSLTTLGGWRVGRAINLERSLRLGDELGGHLVFGHVDGLGSVREIASEHGSLRITVGAPPSLLGLIAQKGSIAIDGVSLTVNSVGDETFGVNLIPHTASVTTLGRLGTGDAVHLEIDMLARYVARQLAWRDGTAGASGRVAGHSP